MESTSTSTDPESALATAGGLITVAVESATDGAGNNNHRPRVRLKTAQIASNPSNVILSLFSCVGSAKRNI